MIQFILGYGHSEFTRVCIESIYNNTPPNEINLVVWENHSQDQLGPMDINPENTVLLKMDLNYGCSPALNAMMKDFGLELDQDVIYISNDHVVFPHWIIPLLENRMRYHVISPMHPYGLHDLHNILVRFLDLKDEMKREYLDHPESRSRIKEYLHLIYGEDFERFVKDNVFPLPEVICTDQFWAGCFFLNKEILGKVSLFRTDRGLACDEDVLWVRDNIKGKYTEGVYSRCYIHHFQSITTNRTGLSMDHAAGAFSRGPVPPMTDIARSILGKGVQRMNSIIKRRSKDLIHHQ